jgi:peptidoglycan/LPS O-acetylase OafA/YrhL
LRSPRTPVEVDVTDAATHPRPVAHGAIPSLDGIRAIAVALVFLAHNDLENVIPGGLGVTVFFVLSGYLISTLMRTEYAARRSLDYRGFYLRRFLRLMPPLVCVVALVGVLAAFSVIDGAFSLGGVLAVLFYYGNYFVIANDFDGLPAGVGVVWSLAVEEHYYLLYPPLAAVLLRYGRAGVSAAVLLALCALVLGWRWWLASNGASEAHLTMATDTRVDAILIGCLMALWRNPWLDPKPAASPRRDALVVGVCLLVLLFTLVYRDEFFRLTVRYSLQSAAVAPLIYLAVARAQRWPFRWLNAKPLVYLGTISYTVYLSHHVILLLVAKHWPGLDWFGATCVAIVMTLAVAEPIRRWVEQPCTRLRKRLHKRRAVASTAPLDPLPGLSSGGPT